MIFAMAINNFKDGVIHLLATREDPNVVASYFLRI